MPCRINRRRMWTHRIILEGLCHVQSSFVTLTYSDEHLPRLENGLATLRSRDLVLFLKRLRKGMDACQSALEVGERKKVRYFAVGEYGDLSLRPHYHLALFGWPHCRKGVSFFDQRYLRCCASCNQIMDAWGLGHVQVGMLTVDSAGYIAGYVTKKMTRKNDERLHGREPEFARMSRVPGIGADALWEVSDGLLKYDLVAPAGEGDVPASLRHGRKMLPLGRYLRGKLREYVGKDSGADVSTLERMDDEVRPMYEAAVEAAKAAPANVRREIEKAYFIERLLEANEGAYRNALALEGIYRKGQKL